MAPSAGLLCRWPLKPSPRLAPSPLAHDQRACPKDSALLPGLCRALSCLLHLFSCGSPFLECLPGSPASVSLHDEAHWPPPPIGLPTSHHSPRTPSPINVPPCGRCLCWRLDPTRARTRVLSFVSCSFEDWTWHWHGVWESTSGRGLLQRK